MQVELAHFAVPVELRYTFLDAVKSKFQNQLTLS